MLHSQNWISKSKLRNLKFIYTNSQDLQRISAAASTSAVTPESSKCDQLRTKDEIQQSHLSHLSLSISLSSPVTSQRSPLLESKFTRTSLHSSSITNRNYPPTPANSLSTAQLCNFQSPSRPKQISTYSNANN